MVKRAGKRPSCLSRPVLTWLAKAGKDTRSIQANLGHKDTRHTVRYTELSPSRFKN
jgi:type 1 fimbriae regulatory protein FimB/type 1 fimbriae regulatory protein FimE